MVKFLRDYRSRATGPRAHAAGDKAEFNTDTEKYLVSNGIAEKVTKPKPKAAKSNGKTDE